MSFLYVWKKRHFLNQLSWAAFGQIATAIGLLVGIRFLTEYVPPDVYGNVTLLLGVTSFVYSLYSLPLFQATIRFFPDAQISDKVSLLRYTIFKLANTAMVCTSIMFVIGGLAYSFFTGGGWWLGALLAAIVVVDVIKILETGLLNAARKQREFAFWNAAEIWGRPLCAVILANCFHVSASLILIGYFSASALILCCFSRRVQPERERSFAGNDRHRIMLEDIYRYALPLAPSALVSGINAFSDRYIIGGFMGFEQVGIYAAASSLMLRPFVIACAIVEQSVRPIYFDSVASDDTRSKDIFSKWILVALSICVVGIIIVAVFRHEIVRIVLAPKYRSIADLLPWLALGYACYSICFIYENVFYAYKKTKIILKINILIAIITVLITIIMTYKYRLFGAALSVLIVNCFKLMVLRYYSKTIPQNADRLNV